MVTIRLSFQISRKIWENDGGGCVITQSTVGVLRGTVHCWAHSVNCH